MKAHELRPGDRLYDKDGRLIYTVVTRAESISPDGVYVEVEYEADGGRSGREFDRDKEVKHVRSTKKKGEGGL